MNTLAVHVEPAAIGTEVEILGHQIPCNLMPRGEKGRTIKAGSRDQYRDRQGESIVTKIVERNIRLLKETLKSISHADFHKAVEAIWRAQMIFFVGFSSSLAATHFLQFRLNRLGKADTCFITRRGLYTIGNSLTTLFSLLNALLISTTLAEKADRSKY